MKNFNYRFIQLIICCLMLSGCDKYLDITPKGKRLLSTVTDYDQWLNDDALVIGHGSPTGTTNYLADNYDYVAIPDIPVTQYDFVYLWAPQYTIDINTPPLLWGEHYAKINLYNTVLVGIDNATGGTTAQKRSLKAEALLGRALEYFYLLNTYAKPYDAATADQDLAVPFVTSNDVTQETPSRSTVAEIYKHLVDDLNSAIPNLPLDNSANRFRGSAAAGYSLLARVYLCARNYPEAQKNAELALSATKAVMLDYNTPNPTTNLVSTRQDVIYGRTIIGQAVPTLEFMRTFSSNDFRLRKFYSSSDGYRFTTRGATRYDPRTVTAVYENVNSGTSVQEMKLIAAECAARSNNLSVALKHLDDIRKSRLPYNALTWVPYASAIQEEVLQEVLRERNRELPFCGLRWFDMRRLDKENRMGTVTRLNAQGTVVATLEPHSNKYTLQIPVQVISFNPNMPQNPY